MRKRWWISGVFLAGSVCPGIFLNGCQPQPAGTAHVPAFSALQAKHKPILDPFWLIQPLETDHDLTDVTFLDHRSGWAVGRHHTILRTQDGGKTWQPMVEPQEDGAHFIAVHFSSPDEGWVHDDRVLLHTRNGGATWQPISLPPGAGLTDAIPVAGHLFVLSHKNQIYRSDDGGQNWTALAPLPKGSFEHVHFTDAAHGWAHGPYVGIARTGDGGKTWILDRSLADDKLAHVQFLDPLHGRATGSNGSTLLATTDGGKTWVRHYTGLKPHDTIQDLHFVDAQRGFLLVGDGRILQSKDGGATWTTMATKLPQGLRAFAFPGVNQGWVVGDKGLVARYARPSDDLPKRADIGTP